MNTETSDNMTTVTGMQTGMQTGLNGSDGEGRVRSVAQKAHEAVDTIEHAIGTSSEKVMGWHQEYGELAREQVRANPLAVVAGAFAVGYLFAKMTR